MKQLFTIVAILQLSFSGWCQKADLTTNEFLVTGEIAKELKIALADIEKYPAKIIGDVIITNHLGEPRGTAKQLSGILVKKLLKTLNSRPRVQKNTVNFI